MSLDEKPKRRDWGLVKKVPTRPRVPVKHDFHFRTPFMMSAAAAALGFVGFFVPRMMISFGIVMTIAAVKCFFYPQWIGWKWFSIPVGRLDALVWLSVTWMFFPMGVAMERGLPPDAYLPGALHAVPKVEHVVPPVPDSTDL